MTEPISLAEAKRHLRLSDDDPGIDDLSGVITAARQAAEQFLNTSIVVQTRTLTLDAFPPVLLLPNGPVISITSVVYIDSDGDQQTLAANAYSFTSYTHSDYIYPIYGTAWPTTRNEHGAVVITYQAGSMAGSPAVLAEETIKSAIKLIMGDLWENREGQFVGVSAVVNPTVANLLYPYRRQLGT